MHIHEGFLTPQVLCAGAAIACAEVGWGLKKTETGKIVKVAMASSVFFLASLVNVKIGPASTHLSLLGLVGILLGWGAPPAIFVALMLQAVLFQFGGLLVLGANTTVMATPALIAHLLFGRAIRKGGGKIALCAAFAAGFLGVLLGAGFCGAFLFLSDPGLETPVKTLLAAHIPVAFVEGIAALFMTAFLKRTYPDVLRAAA